MVRILLFSCVLGIALPMTPFVQAEPILSTTGTETLGGRASSLGWEFQTGSSPVTVGALDALFDDFGFSSAQVRLYDSLGITLRSATVTTADPTETAGLTWNVHPISPITLAPDTTYFIAEDVPNNTPIAFIVTSTPVLGDGVQYVKGVLVPGTGNNPTTDALSGSENPAYFGPNFDPIGPAVIPEPSTLSLLAAGLGIAGWWRRRRTGRVG